MEEERGGLPPIYDHHHHHNLQISFSAPHHHHHHQEMGFVQFEDHNPVLSFLVAPPLQSPHMPHHLDGGGAKPTADDNNNNNNGSLGFNHGEVAVNNRPSWNNDQVSCSFSLSLQPSLSLFFTHCKFEIFVPVFFFLHSFLMIASFSRTCFFLFNFFFF